LKLRGATPGWLTIAAYVVGHNVLAAGRDREMLSEAADRYIASHPVFTRTIIALVALHVANALPPRFDPCHQIFQTVEKLARAIRG
jgi:hypothetical protein